MYVGAEIIRFLNLRIGWKDQTQCSGNAIHDFWPKQRWLENWAAPFHDDDII
jgi:hypothetical protein